MSKVLLNEKLSEDFYLLKVSEKNKADIGQFYMIRSWGKYPILSRPISVFDSDGENISFLYKVVGEGTKLLSDIKEGDDITLNGPYGNGFPLVEGKVALVGGGLGIAPLYLTAKKLKNAQVDIYLGFSSKAVLTKEYEEVSDNLKINVGGFITDEIDPRNYDYILTCGPEIMMKTLYNKCVSLNAKAKLYVSMEKKMACGMGICLVCSCKTKNGNKKVCTDGPVFEASEVF